MGCRLLSHSIHQNNLFQWVQGQNPWYITTNTSHEVTALLIFHQSTWDHSFFPFSLWESPVWYLQEEKHSPYTGCVLTWSPYLKLHASRDALCMGFTWVVNSVLTIFPKYQRSPVKVRTRTLLKGEGDKKSVKNKGFQSNEECDDKTVKQFPSVDVIVWIGEDDKLRN